MPVLVREATSQDSPEIRSLIAELAATIGEQSALGHPFVTGYLAFPGNTILLAEEDGQVVGLLSFSVRPSLSHAANSCLIEDLIVREPARSRGVGRALLEAVVQRAQAAGCVEVSVTTMPDNLAAINFYRRHGLVDEAVFLEKHLAGQKNGEEPTC